MRRLVFGVGVMVGACMMFGCGESVYEQGPDVPQVDTTDSTKGDSVFVIDTANAEPLTAEWRGVIDYSKRWVVERVQSDEVFDTAVFYFDTISRTDEDVRGFVTYPPTSKWRGESYIAWKEVDKKLYAYGPGYHIGTMHWFLAADFEPAGKYCLEYASKLYPVSTGRIVLQNKWRRCVEAHMIVGDSVEMTEYFVEGIGLLMGTAKCFGLEYNRPRFGRLLYVYDGDELIYDHDEFRPELYVREKVLE